MGIRVTRPGRKHRIGKAHIVAALANAQVEAVDGDAVRLVGIDDRGIELELVIVPDDKQTGGMAVIHAMPTRFRSARGVGE